MTRLLLTVVLTLGFLGGCGGVDRGDPAATLQGAIKAAAQEDLPTFLEFYRPQDRPAVALAFASSRGAGVTTPAALASFGLGSPRPLTQTATRARFDLAPPSGALLDLEKADGRWYLCLPAALRKGE